MKAGQAMLVGSAVMIALAGLSAGCGPKGPPAAVLPPPAPPPRIEKNETYDYQHTVSPRMTSPRWAVAILRFGDLPPEPAVTPPPPDTVKIDIRRPGPVQPPPQINKRGRDLLKLALVESKAFTVVERERIVELIREINFGQTDLVDPATSPQTAQLIAVRYFIEGSLGLNEDETLKGTIPPDADLRELHNPGGLENLFDPTRGGTRSMGVVIRELYQRNLREMARATFAISCIISAYEIHTGQVVATVMGIGATGQQAINDAVDELVLTLMKLRREARIAAVLGPKVYLDVGKSEVKLGDKLDVIRQDTPIRDRNGLVIGHEETQVGQVEVTEVQPLMSLTKILRGSGFARGQLCRPAKAEPAGPPN